MELSGKAALAGVMGWPVSHSLSPRLHGYWLRELGLDGAYLPLAVHPDDCPEVLKTLPKMGFRGCNLTIPHKEIALEVMDEIDPLARRIGAVNTVVVDADGRLIGRNTDGYGFLKNLQTGAPNWRPEAGPAVVLGAGGAARAVIVALLDAGVAEIRLTNRTRERAEELARTLDGNIVVIDWEQRSDGLDGAELLVNTTVLGMTGQPPLDITLDSLPESATVTDIVYAPLITDLLENARDRGHPIVDGLGMLLHQAVPGFAAWFGVEPVVTEDLRRGILEAMG